MTERKDNRDDVADMRVRRTYREVASERTPAALDRRVLRQAADDIGVRRMSAWFRPLAFAATLVLGVALLFEMQSGTEPVPETLPDLPARRAQEPAMALPARESARERADDEASQADDAAPAALMAPQPASSTMNKAAAEQDKLEERIESGRQAAEAPAMPATPRAAEEAADRAVRYRMAEPRNAVPQGLQSSDDGAVRCDPDETTDAATWWRCIEALRAAGFDAAASAELERLRARFPEFADDRVP